jgi:hypothetical protein
MTLPREYIRAVEVLRAEQELEKLRVKAKRRIELADIKDYFFKKWVL